MKRAVLAAAIVLLAVPAPAPAPVPPQDCGFITVGSQRYNVKGDQMRCKQARKSTRKYVNGRGAPDGFRCTNYGPETAIEFRCAKGKAEFFAIRR